MIFIYFYDVSSFSYLMQWYTKELFAVPAEVSHPGAPRRIAEHRAKITKGSSQAKIVTP